MAFSRADRSLAQLIRRSPALDASARRQWLAVLPHLAPDDRERLREILTEAEEGPYPPTAARREHRLRRRPSPVRGGGGEGTAP
jgi:hypothetical protein